MQFSPEFYIQLVILVSAIVSASLATYLAIKIDLALLHAEQTQQRKELDKLKSRLGEL